MSYSRRSRHDLRSPSPYWKDRSFSVSRSRSRSRSCESSDVGNPGNTLYVTGLSPRITKDEIERHFSSEGKVIDVHLVMDPWTRESHGFAFVTMATVKEANNCLKYLDRSVLERRVITVEKARRRRGRTPTPGRYLGPRNDRARHRSPSYSPYRRGGYYYRGHSSERERSHSPYYGRSHYRHDSRRRHRSFSHDPRSYTPPSSRYKYRDRSLSSSLSPRVRRYCRRCYSRSILPGSRRSYSRSLTPRPRRYLSSYSRSYSPIPKRSYSRSLSPRPRRDSRSSYSPMPRRSKRSPSCSVSARQSKRRYSCESYADSRSTSSRSVSRSPKKSS